MGDIYRNAFVTLAATASKNGQGGCFLPDQDTVAPKEFKLDSCQSPTKEIIVREKITHWILPPTAATLEHHPLLTRGWTFQERILSPRVIHFCNRELVWECKSQTTCECHGHSARSKSSPTEQSSQVIKNTRSGQSSMADTFPLISLMSGNHSTAQTDHKVIMSEQWQRIVEQYSALNLTKETDRLPALSGLAQRASPALGVYLAGLWSSTLIPNLMWRVDKLNMKRERHIKYTGPSWSWVSVNGPVTYWRDLQLDKLLEELKSSFPSTRSMFIERALLRAGTVNKFKSDFDFLPVGHLVVLGSKNPFGSISSGAFILLRHVKAATLKYVYTRQGFGATSSDYGQREVDKQKYDLQIGYIELPFFTDYILCDEGPGHIEEFQTLYIMVVHPDVCLVLRKTASVADSWAGEIVSNGNDLLVSTFERVGTVRQPRAFLDTYLLDWMTASREELVMIN